MSLRQRTVVALLSVLFISVVGAGIAAQRWGVHDMNRPVPPVVTPAADCGMPPSNAIVLFDGNDFSNWVSQKDGSPPKWKVQDGYMEIIRGAGGIKSKQAFGSCHLHIEWAAPQQVRGEGQGRGNSGIFLMGAYEIQVLDSYDNRTYADGQAGAVYGQTPPLVNASRKPGEWQTYDIIFQRPVFGDADHVVRPAYVTILHNGVVVQAHTQLTGATAHKAEAKYRKHADKLPIALQDHNNPVRFRNIWVVELPDE